MYKRQVQYGLLDEANGGVLYLAEIFELDGDTQVRLLNALKERRFMRSLSLIHI